MTRMTRQPAGGDHAKVSPDRGMQRCNGVTKLFLLKDVKAALKTSSTLEAWSSSYMGMQRWSPLTEC